MTGRGVLVVGASLAGVRTVEALRRAGYTGRLTLAGAEPHLPYDRPPLSKLFLTEQLDAEHLRLVEPEVLEDLDVELHLGDPAVGLDLEAAKVAFASGERLAFNDLVIATGARARNPFPNASAGVHTVRTLEDAVGLRADLRTARDVIIVGAGFIGLEVASSARSLRRHVTVVEAADIPLSRSLGPTAAIPLAELAVAAGVRLVCGRSVTRLLGTDRVRAVELDDGQTLRADAVVAGIGAVPNIEWLAGSGLEADHRGVRCDSSGRACHSPRVWAVGDVAAWANADGVHRRYEHWTAAGDQARIVAANLLDDGDRTVTSAPYVWSEQFGRKISIVGETHDHDAVDMLSAEPADFAALYSRNGVLVGACVVDQMPLVLKCRTWVARAARVRDIPALSRAAG